jgi:hypothetical protein
MLQKTAFALLAALLVIGIFGCYRTTNLDYNWGRSFETARFNQTLNPYGLKAASPAPIKNVEQTTGRTLPAQGLEKTEADRVMENIFRSREQK